MCGFSGLYGGGGAVGGQHFSSILVFEACLKSPVVILTAKSTLTTFVKFKKGWVLGPHRYPKI